MTCSFRTAQGLALDAQRAQHLRQDGGACHLDGERHTRTLPRQDDRTHVQACWSYNIRTGSASMLPLLSSSVYAFFLSSLLSLRSCFLSDARVLLTYRRRTHMRRHHQHCAAAEIRDRPCPPPGLNTRSSRSHGLNPLRWRLPLALRPAVSNELLSVRAGAPVTRYFMRLATPAGRPEEATPSIQRRATQALHYHGLPPPASSARRDPVGLKLFPHFEGRSCR